MPYLQAIQEDWKGEQPSQVEEDLWEGSLLDVSVLLVGSVAALWMLSHLTVLQSPDPMARPTQSSGYEH